MRLPVGGRGVLVVDRAPHARRVSRVGDSRNNTLRVLKRYIARETFALIRDALRRDDGPRTGCLT